MPVEKLNMSVQKMSREEIIAEGERLGELIRKGSEAELRGVAELKKRSWTIEEMRAQVIRHQIEANWIHKGGELPIPLKLEMKIARRIAKVLEHGYAPSMYR